MKKTGKRIMWGILLIIGFLVLFVFIFIQQPSFGKSPQGERLERIKKSPNYRNGKFQNLHDTPQLTEGAGYFSVFWDFFFKDHPKVTPADEIPSVKTDLLHLNKDEDILVWFGHSSYYIQLDGKRILTDPVFSGSTSPVSFTNKSFKGTDIYTVEDLPDLDYLFITHDHWDHLDYKTILELKSKVKKVICGLGVGEHLEYWGFNKNQIIELDWNEDTVLDSGFSVYCLPARHFSGRGLNGNKSLWVSFLIKAPTFTFYMGGDSGYDTHFSEIGKRFGVIDLAILENGQYGKNWKYIHMMPKEVLQAAHDLKAKRLFPVHSSKFALSTHPWDEPLKRISELHTQKDPGLLTPMIGEKVYLKDSTQIFTPWWKDKN